MANFIAGQYTATLAGASLGQTAEGYRISHSFFKRLILGDSYAQTPQDEVYQGEEVFCQMRLIQYDAAGVQGAMNPFASYLSVGRVGRVSVQQGLVSALVLTAVSGPPAQNTPASVTLTNAIIAEGYPVELLFAPDLREVPLRMRCFPSQAGSFGSVA